MREINELSQRTTATTGLEGDAPEAWASPEAVPSDVVPQMGRPAADPRSFAGPEATPPRGVRTPAIPSLAAIGGHPLHPMVVPLPIGAFTFAIASDLAYAATRDRFWARASATLIGAGIATGALAGVLGATDFVGRERVRDRTEAWIHGAGNAAALGLAATSLAVRRRDTARAIMPVGLALSLVTGVVLLVTGWLGGELAYRYRIGVTAD